MKRIMRPALAISLITMGTLALAGCTPSSSPTIDSDSSNSSSTPSHISSTPTPEEESVLFPYSEARFNELKGTQKFALYFSAEWCPKCKATKQAIAQNPEAFEGVTLLDVDYDTATGLKQQYGITMQHTFVFFDEDGNAAETLVMPADEAVIAFFAAEDPSSDQPSSEPSAEISAPRYIAYSASEYETQLGKAPMALFFHAEWCPTCRLQDQVINEDLNALPLGTTLFKVDYDKEQELKQTYGITMQSVIVVLDEEGKEVGRIADFKSIEPLAELIAQSL